MSALALYSALMGSTPEQLMLTTKRQDDSSHVGDRLSASSERGICASLRT